MGLHLCLALGPANSSATNYFPEVTEPPLPLVKKARPSIYLLGSWSWEGKWPIQRWTGDLCPHCPGPQLSKGKTTPQPVTGLFSVDHSRTTSPPHTDSVTHYGWEHHPSLSLLCQCLLLLLREQDWIPTEGTQDTLHFCYSDSISQWLGLSLWILFGNSWSDTQKSSQGHFTEVAQVRRAMDESLSGT